ncbi:UvrD-helicase domain-containing protein, partial [Nocardia aobensis]
MTEELFPVTDLRTPEAAAHTTTRRRAREADESTGPAELFALDELRPEHETDLLDTAAEPSDTAADSGVEEQRNGGSDVGRRVRAGGSASFGQFDLCGDLPTGTTVLEASAGTGKTYAIVGLAVRFVAEGLVDISQLLLVTFTRAATQELRERTRERFVTVA